MKANPDDFVILVPHAWGPDAAALVKQTHAEVWQEELSLTMAEDGGDAVVSDVSVDIRVDEPIREIAQLAPTSLEPFGASAIALLEQHKAIWRLTAPGGPDAAAPLLRLVNSMTEAGASAALLPAIKRLHSPRSVQRITMNLDARALTNFFVNAFDDGDWMRTRGLTAFGFPEVETPIVDGLNSAYYRLMDLSAGMIGQAGPFPSGGRVRLGPYFFRLEEGPRGPDDEIPVNGIHGVQSLLPKEYIHGGD